MIAAAVLGFDAVKPDEASATIVRDPTATCAERPASAAAPTAVQGGHPERSLYGVDAAPPERDLAHVLGDGYVVVRYRRNVTRDQERALEEWSGGQVGLIVAPASARAAPVVEARSAKLRFTCDGINVERLAAFQERWLRERRADATR